MSDVIRLNREQSILVVRALKAVELLGYKKAEEICLEDFNETKTLIATTAYRFRCCGL